ncbi:MAG TPA: DUF6292 family protein [Pseudonocardiaceae bacterium]|jgi:hypothetical protein
MTMTLDTVVSSGERLRRGLRRYLDSVAADLGVGLESTMIDLDTPVSAYLALDHRLTGFPDRDLALLWDEEHGWSAAIETHSGEDLIVVSYLDSDTVVPPGELVVRFVDGLLSGRDRLGGPDQPTIRMAGNQPPLAELLSVPWETGPTVPFGADAVPTTGACPDHGRE